MTECTRLTVHVSVLDATSTAYRAVSLVFAPRLLGIENVPVAGPNVFVGNHTMGFWADISIVMLELYRRLGVKLWTCGDHFHYRIPLWRDLVIACGVIDGTHENCEAVLGRGDNLLILPGGAREATKSRRDRYRLLWRGRTGFATLAIQSGARIGPWATVGGDDYYDILIDSDDLLAGRAGGALLRLLRRLEIDPADYMPPLIKGVGPTLFPRLQRLYYAFGEPIDAPPDADPAKLSAAAEESVEALLADLVELRRRDRKSKGD